MELILKHETSSNISQKEERKTDKDNILLLGEIIEWLRHKMEEDKEHARRTHTEPR